ncbi:MAG: hypothetical protein RLN88_11870 [Ekhidna sp.]|uniref:hypothetical protein n=1 Tax=Ekhidna sp. TaxID=2608089 RepID=UPI0032EBB850
MRLLIHLCFIVLLLAAGCGPKKKEQESNTKRDLPEDKPLDIQSFDYQPLKPINGQLKAVIEVGSLGLNYFIIEIDKDGRWTLEKSFFGRSNIIYGVSSTAEILAQIESFNKEIRALGVSAKNIHLVASSSVGKLGDTSSLVAELAKSGMKLIPISADREAELALIATIPKEFISESFLVDIGSGNTKISWVSNMDTFSIETHGSKYFLGDVQDTTVFRQVRDALLKVPQKNRNLCFMLGGMIYELTKDEVKDDERYLVLNPPGEYATTNERSKAANVIYSAIYLEPTYSYIFDRKSNFSIGYLISLDK